MLVRVAPGPHHEDDVERVVRVLGRHGVCDGRNQCTVSTTIRPTDILNYSRVQATPIALAAVLGLLAAGAIANVLLSSVRRRRRDFAILATLGFARRQVLAAVAWQATALVVLALVVGLPAGIALGRWIWTVFASGLGIVPDPQVPVVALLAAIPIALVLANGIAAPSGWLARRSAPATVLRTE